MKAIILLLVATLAIITGKAQYSAGSTMSATIDGKPWTAHAVYSTAATGKIVGSYKASTIALPFWKPYKAGDKAKFNDKYVVMFSPVDDPAPANSTDSWSGRSGQMEVTKVSGDWVDGTFTFTATFPGVAKKIEVTNGVFHINAKN